MSATTLLVILGAIVLYGAFAASLDRRSITMPLAFLLLGALAGPGALGLIALPVTDNDVALIAEITLGLLLFADASALDLWKVRADAALPARLLLIGLPVSVVLGTLAAGLMYPAAGIGVALLLGAMLAPTDTALGLRIFTNPLMPLRVRRALNVESGLNDGIATPLVTLAIALSTAPAGAEPAGWVVPALTEIALAVLVGALLGIIGGLLVATADERGWSSNLSRQPGVLALALLVYGSAITIGGNGFIAAFFGGLLFGAVTRGRIAKSAEYAELSALLLSLVVWTIFGANVVPILIETFSPPALLFAALALTLIRMASVAVALTGARFQRLTMLVMGWLGPRGLASVIFLMIAFKAFAAAGIDPEPLDAAGWTVVLSVVLHAVTASPLARTYVARLQARGPGLPELAVISGAAPRLPSWAHPRGAGSPADAPLD